MMQGMKQNQKKKMKNKKRELWKHEDFITFPEVGVMGGSSEVGDARLSGSRCSCTDANLSKWELKNSIEIGQLELT